MGGVIFVAAENEEEVGEPVQEDESRGVHWMGDSSGEGFAFRSASDSACHVQVRRSGCARGKDKLFQGRQFLAQTVQRGFEGEDVFAGDPDYVASAQRRRQICPKREELFLEWGEDLPCGLRRRVSQNDAEVGI